MSDLAPVLNLWKELSLSGEDYVLATIIGVEGSSYRKPGARMLIAKSGRRAGTISGGCLEGEVTTKAWWHTEKGPVVKTYSTAFDIDDEIPPYGLGCGGTVQILLERRNSAEVLLQLLYSAFEQRLPASVITVIDGDNIGFHICRSSFSPMEREETSLLHRLAGDVLSQRRTRCNLSMKPEQDLTVFAEYVPARTGLFIFGAGDDVSPLVTQAKTLDWFVSVQDGRSNLATKERFPAADVASPLDLEVLPQFRETDAALLMTHSYEQDFALLCHLLPQSFAYLGILGPRHRTEYLLERIASELEGDLQEYMRRLYTPMGLDLNATGPATIALSILAEIQATIAGGTGSPLRRVKQRQIAITERA